MTMQKRSHQVKVTLNDQELNKLENTSKDLTKSEKFRKFLNEREHDYEPSAVPRIMYSPLSGLDSQRIEKLCERWQVSKSRAVAILVNRQLEKEFS